ncbi:hypothetical protein Tsubulata_027513 [Turnera subulata]|uniref:C-JID domain-containing protein n=1 Tax=Turnera subulata TaxID=218843 RepID=A0A9Q0G5T2_9ROSI|nr:hypothetical protein Tsubulata_027513 [Turnera subulata]
MRHSLSRMYNLRLLKIYSSTVGSSCSVQLPHGLESISDELRYLHWESYQLRSLPLNFNAENLVELNLSSSNVTELWQGEQNLANLKELNLSHCRHLSTFPNFSNATNLERLNLQFCTSLERVSLPTRPLNKLLDLDMRYCTSLVSLPASINSRSLRTINFSGCSSLRKCPQITGENITYMSLNETLIEELPHSIGFLESLITLNLKGCKRLGKLPDSISLLKSLIIFDLSGCSSITKISLLSETIRYLYLNGTGIEELPSSIDRLPRLCYLDLMNCTRLQNLPSSIFELKYMEKLVLSCCSSITTFPNVTWNVKKLYLDGTTITEIPQSIEFFSVLVELSLQNCTRFEILPDSFCRLQSLEKLNLSGCSRFCHFPPLKWMTSLKYLYLDGTAIECVPSSITQLTRLSTLEMRDCKNLKDVGFLADPLLSYGHLKYLRMVSLDGCGLLQLPAILGDLRSLEILDLSRNRFSSIPLNMEFFSELEYLGLRFCENLTYLPQLPPRLTKLDAHNCISLKKALRSTSGVKGNNFEFIFTNCFKLDEKTRDRIMAYALTKIQLYATNLCNKVDVPAGASSFCFPGSVLPDWFSHQTSGSSIVIQLPSCWANNGFMGFIFSAVVAFKFTFFSGSSGGFEIKCRYRFRNDDGEFQHGHSYFGSCYNNLKERWNVRKDHLFFAHDHPCLDSKKKGFTEVLVDFDLLDMDNNPLRNCTVIKCGVHLLNAGDELYEAYDDPNLLSLICNIFYPRHGN